MRMALKLLRSDWRSGELLLLVSALFLSVVIVTGLTLFIDRLQIILAGESHQFLAADRVLTSPQPVDKKWLTKANALGLQQTQHLTFQSMLYANDQPQLVSVKAADEHYPLRGQLTYRLKLYGDLLSSSQGPKVGEIWIESRLFHLLTINIGDTVYIGDAPLKVTAELVSEPDRGAGSLSMGARVLMHWQDIEKTAVVGEGSRLSYSYLFAGKEADVDKYVKWLLPQLSDHEKWLDLDNAQPTVAIAMARAKSFFLLASSIVVILASIAIAMASTRFSQRHVKQVAILKTLGATSSRIKMLYLQLLTLLLIGSLLLAWIVAWAIQEYIVVTVANTMQVNIPPIEIYPFLLGFIVATLSLAAFAFPPLLSLKNISAIKILQTSDSATSLFDKKQQLLAVISLWIILAIYTQQWWLSSILIVSLIMLCVCIALPAAFFLKRLGKTSLLASGWLTLAKSNLTRRLKINALQMAIFAISFMLFLLIIGIKNSLFTQWQEQLPEQTPNYFLMNIQESQWQDIDQWLKQHKVKSEQLYPMIKARLIEINSKPVREFVSKEELSRAGADRELNLSWAEVLSEDNRVIEGEWVASAKAKDTVSVEKKLAQNLNIHVGDQLTFMMAADTFTAKVGSIRSVEWDRMRPNFYMLLSEKKLAPFAKTYMTSFWLPVEKTALVTQLLKQFPTIVVIDIDVLIKQIRRIIHHVSLALEVILVFVILASLLVLYATVQQTLVERTHENAIIRALGGTRQLIAKSLVAEFALIGLIAGLMASLGAELLLLVLQKNVFDMPLQLHPELWLIAPVLGMCLIGSAGYWSAKKVLQVAPMQLLRHV